MDRDYEVRQKKLQSLAVARLQSVTLVGNRVMGIGLQHAIKWIEKYDKVDYKLQ